MRKLKANGNWVPSAKKVVVIECIHQGYFGFCQETRFLTNGQAILEEETVLLVESVTAYITPICVAILYLSG